MNWAIILTQKLTSYVAGAHFLQPEMRALSWMVAEVFFFNSKFCKSNSAKGLNSQNFIYTMKGTQNGVEAIGRKPS